MKRRRTIHLLHLDLGIGGAERLMVNIALSLISLGYDPLIVTTHHDPQHCFEEAKVSGVLYKRIKVVGSWLPPSIFGRGTALCSHFRMVYASFWLLWLHYFSSNGDNTMTTLILDGVSSPLPLFSWANVPTIFYCHYPDMLLCTSRTNALTRIYRFFIDTAEEITTGCATTILVNSLFTKEAFRQAFPRLWPLVQPEVLYPSLEDVDGEESSTVTPPPPPPPYISLGAPKLSSSAKPPPPTFLFVSLNRYERKKKVELALEAMALLKADAKAKGVKVLLVVAGGFDPRVVENIEYLAELKAFATNLDLLWSLPPSPALLLQDRGASCDCDVVFRLSITASERNALLHHATALLYTPDKEHFGIVPLEAMRAGAPVIAVKSGGPVETVLDKETGYLCDQSATAFARAMDELVPALDKTTSGGAPCCDDGLRVVRSSLSLTMGNKGKQHVQARFSSASMAEGLRDCLQKTSTVKPAHQRQSLFMCVWALSSALAVFLACLLGFHLMK